MKFFRHQIFYLFFRLHCFLFLILNFPFLSYFPSFYYPLLFCLLLFFLSFFIFLFLLLSFSSFFFLFLLPWFLLLRSSLSFTLLWTSHNLHFSHSLVDLRIIAYKPWHLQDYTSLLFPNHINLYSLPIPLVVDIHFYCMLNRSLLVKRTIHISYIYIGLSIFFNLNLCFLANSELITSPITPLFNNIIQVYYQCSYYHCNLLLLVLFFLNFFFFYNFS